MNRLFGKGKWRFQNVQVTESTDRLINPACGWCRIYTFYLERKIDFDELYWSLQDNETLVQAVIVIGAFRSLEIPGEALLQLEQLMQFFREHQKEMILRFTYDNTGQGLLAEPDEIQQIVIHIRQIGSLLRQYADDILLLQGLFIGSWGEMHNSRYLSKEKLRLLAQTLRDVAGEQIPIAVRTPLQWRILHKQDMESLGRVCVFNDGMFGSDSDLGTYGRKQRSSAAWEESWSRLDELLFLEEVHQYLPYGGEAVGTAKESELKQAVTEMRQVHLCYLNAVHDKQCLDRWQSMRWEGKGIWKGMNGLDYIGAHLGYRPVIRKVSGKVTQGLHLDIELENTGFAGMLEEAELIITAEAEGRNVRTKLLSLLPKDFMPHVPCHLSCQFAPEKENGEYRIYVQMRRKRDRRCISFANGRQHEKVWIGLFLNL